MTTHTIFGSVIYTDFHTNEVVGLDNTDVTQQFVVSDGVTSLRYAGTDRGQDIPSSAKFSVNAHHVWLDGQKFQKQGFPDWAFVLEFDWTDGGGIPRTSVVLDYIELGVTVAGLGLVDVEYIFAIGGDAFPSLGTISDYHSIQGNLTGVRNATGHYGPDQGIAFADLGGTVSEDDVIRGTGAGNTILGGLGDDLILGLGGADTLRGGDGEDRVSGGKGRDTLYGGAQADQLFGQKGADKLIGGRGADLLSGGAGNDVLTGGKGGDVFVFSAGKDVIADFNTASTIEKVDLRGVGSIKGFGDLIKNHLGEVGGAAVIDDLGGNTLTMNNVKMSDLGAGDFIF